MPTPSGAMTRPTVQVHVTRTCNLSCRHCYSLSGPSVTERLDVDLVVGLLHDAVEEGYRTLALSGGEPLLYDGLAEVLSAARDLGMSTSMTTNGTLFGHRTWREVAELVDSVAVSVDGPPDLHDDLRGSPTAYSRMEAGLAILRASEVPFGFIHTVTRRSIRHLDWLGAFAASNEASLLQLHPLGLVGAGRDLADLAPDGEVMALARIGGLALQQEHDLVVQVDVFNAVDVRRNPERVHAHPDGSNEGPLAELVNPIVVMANGDVSPICHAMPEPLRLGNLHDQPLHVLADDWREHGHAVFRAHCRVVWERLEPTLDWPYFNWYEVLERAPVPAASERPRRATPA